MRQRNAVRPIVEQVKLTLTPGEDDDLIDWFQRLPDGLRAASVKAALRGGTSFPVTGTDSDNKTDDLDSLIA